MLTDYERSHWPESLVRVQEALSTDTLGTAHKRDVEILLAHFEGGWISVKEKEPPECTVICCDMNRVVHVAVYRPSSYTYRWDCDTYGLKPQDVTHWQPLPAPPMHGERTLTSGTLIRGH